MEVEDIVNNFISNDIKTNIDDRSKYLTLLPALISTNSKEVFKDKLMEAVNCVDKESLKEAVYQTVPYLGFGKVYPFLVITEEVLGKTEDASTTNNDNRYSKGLETQYNLFGKENIDKSRNNENDDFKFIWDYLASYCFGDFYTRKYLSYKERELITFATLASFGDVVPQLSSHIYANLSLGNSKELLVEVVKNLVPYLGFPRSLNTINIIKNITEKGEDKFGLGEENTAFAKYFIGKSYLNPLTDPNKTSLFIANVTFEPACRNNWHIHHAKSGGGQILICVDGEGWYQEEGKDAVSLKPGMVIPISANVKY